MFSSSRWVIRSKKSGRKEYSSVTSIGLIPTSFDAMSSSSGGALLSQYWLEDNGNGQPFRSRSSPVGIGVLSIGGIKEMGGLPNALFVIQRLMITMLGKNSYAAWMPLVSS